MTNWEICKSCPWAGEDDEGVWSCKMGDLVTDEDLIKADEEGDEIDCDIVHAAFREEEEEDEDDFDWED